MQGWAPGPAWDTRRQGGALAPTVLRPPPGLFTRREAVDSFPTCPPSSPGHPGPSLVSQPPGLGPPLTSPAEARGASWSNRGTQCLLFSQMINHRPREGEWPAQRHTASLQRKDYKSSPRTSTRALSRKCQPFGHMSPPKACWVQGGEALGSGERVGPQASPGERPHPTGTSSTLQAEHPVLSTQC